MPSFQNIFPLASLATFQFLNFSGSLRSHYIITIRSRQFNFKFFRLASLAFNFNMNVLVSHLRTPTHMNLCTIYTSLFIITRIQNSNTPVVS